MNEAKNLPELIKEYLIENNLFKNNGVFIEAGAFDGLSQSNTLLFEEVGWKGLLIEPSKEAFKKCLINRPDCITINKALVSFKDYKKSNYIKGDFNSDIMSSVNAKRSSKLRRKKYKRLKKFYQLPLTYTIDYFKQIKKAENNISIEGIPLSNLLHDLSIEEVDLFILDVEGFEYSVLKGINFKIHKPKIIVIEIYKTQFKKITKLLVKNGYNNPVNLTNFSKERNPDWDGLHNDYIFTLNSRIS